MFQVGADWNPQQEHLKEIIFKRDKFEEMIRLLSKMHAFLHASSVDQTPDETLLDEVWSGLDDLTFRTMPTVKDVTVAWNIWHITRIEDLTANILIADDHQVLDQSWLTRLNTKVTDTGNAMSDPEIIAFSGEVVMDELYQYRRAVGVKTKTIIAGLQPDDLKRKITRTQLERIAREGGVVPEAAWLLDFWGRKNVAGILLMPITRHQVGHLNDCRALKRKCHRCHP